MRSSLIDRVARLEGAELTHAEVQRMLAQQGITPAMVCEMVREVIAELEARVADGHGADPYDAVAVQTTGCHCDTEALAKLRTTLAEMEADHAPV